VNRTEAQDPYCYPGTDVLINQVGLRDRALLDTYEAQIVALNLAELSQKPITGPFDATRLKETHRRIFEGVYSWAGNFRTNTGVMSKRRPQGYVVTYGDSQYVGRELEKVFKALAAENYLRGQPLDIVVARGAHYYGEIDARHPFREGNSRTVRQFSTDLLRQAGVALEWSRISETPGSRERLMFARDQAVVQGDSTHLAELMGEASSPITPDRELGRFLGTPQEGNRPARDGSYVGPVKAVSATEVLQDVGGHEIRHELAKFMSGSGGWKSLQAGTAVRIEYKEGLWKVRDPNQQVRSRISR
jgi:fido (protein-threonine AMPylation protein)